MSSNSSEIGEIGVGPGEVQVQDSAVHQDSLQSAVQSSSEVREQFRKELVPLAFDVYKIQMLSSDERIAKAAADSVMKIEGSLATSQGQAGQAGTGVAFNFDFGSLLGALRKISTAHVEETEGE